MKFRATIFIATYFLVSVSAFGDPPESETGAKPQEKSKSLELNADIIEGQLKRPQILLDLGNYVMDIESILISRDDFNDYQEVDMRKRLRYVPPELSQKIK